jgi:hypothetical protein
MLIAVRAWILLSTLLVADGWILSALHALNRTGYLVSFALAVLLLLIFWRPKPRGFVPLTVRTWRKFKGRLKRPAPLFFFLSCLLILAGGILSRAGNWDTDAYRIPRVLHWLGAGGWHWIHTSDSRMNIAGCGFEWLFAPQILFLGSDRWLFVINLISFALLPGLVFTFLRQLGIASGVAWWWMWILSFGWCFVQQAGSPLNDSMGAVYAVAAVVFALRAAAAGKPGELWLSLLAAALLTGVKQTSLPLLLPLLVALWPGRRLWLKQPAVSSLVIVLGLLVSAVTTSCLNWKYSGTWSGINGAPVPDGLNWGNHQELRSPLWGLIGNAFCFPVQNLLPPFFPWATAWNAAMQRFLHSSWGTHFTQFENFGYLSPGLSPTNAGIGFGVVVMAVISVWCARRYRRPAAIQCAPGSPKRGSGWLWLMRLAPWVCLLIFLAKVGTYQNARQAAPYYVLLFPLVLSGAGHFVLVRRRWWQCLALATMAGVVVHLTFVRGLDIAPASVARHLQSFNPHSKLLSALDNYYAIRASVDAQRSFLQVSGVAGEKLIGYATTYGASEPGFWLPFGSRHVERVLPGDSPPGLRAQGIHYVVVDDLELVVTGETIGQWAERYRGDLVNDLVCEQRYTGPPTHLYLVRLRE